MNIPYDEAKALIAKYDFCDFADYSDNLISIEWITKAEKKLGFTLPESYKWWLYHYGGGELYDEEVFSIYQKEFGTFVGNDIVYRYLNGLEKGESKDYVRILDGDDESFCFQITENKNGEYPVYRFDYLSDEYEFYAPSFIHFLVKRIKEWV